MSKKLKNFNTAYYAILILTLLFAISMIIYCHTIDTGNGWDNFGYRIIGILIAIFVIPLIIELFSSVRFFLFSDKKSATSSFLHATSLILFLLVVLSLIVLFFYPADLLYAPKGTAYIALCAAILYVTTKFIHLVYFIVKKFTQKSITEEGDSIMHEYSVIPPEQPKIKREFSTLDSVVAWLSFIGGYAFCRFFPVSDRPLGGFFLILSAFIAASIFMCVKGNKPSVIHIIAALSAIAVSSSLILTSNDIICHLVYMYSITVFCYYLYAVGGNSRESGLSNFIIADMLTALFVAPFLSVSNVFKPMFSCGKSGKIMARIIAGVAIAIVPTLLVFVLLSTNSGFYSLMEKIFDVDAHTIFSHGVSLIFAIPISTYSFGLFISSSDGKGKEYFLKRREAAEIIEKAKRLSPLSTIIAVLPILFLYAVFFVSQFEYYVSGFTGVLPDGFSYADYAREGFFGLCAVSFINLSIIIGVILFMKQDSRISSAILKIIVVVYSLCTLVLISTAMAKMLMYIDAYGLTPKRVYVTSANILLAIIFLITAVKQFIPKWKNATIICIAVCIVFFGAVAVSDLEGIIARYNTDRYIDGTLDVYSASDLYDLGDSAIPSLIRLCEEVSGQQTEHLVNYLNVEKWKFNDEEFDLFAFNIPHLKAKSALKKFNP